MLPVLFSAFLVNGDMSSDITSDAVDVKSLACFSVQAVYTGSPNGTLYLQGSNDGVSYSTISSTAISSAGNVLYNVSFPGYNYVRVFYDASSGSGTLNVSINGKE